MMHRVLKFILTVSGLTCMPLFMGMHTSSSVIYRDNHLQKAGRVIDSAVAILRSGDVVLRSGLGAGSYMLAQMNSKDKTYSHCGIVIMEKGYPFVYHSIGGEDNPDARLRRDSAVTFFSPAANYGLAVVRYDFDTAAIVSLKKVVKEYYRQRPQFDLQFDLATDDKLYCTEFVYKAINKAVNDTAYITPTHFLGRTFVATDNLFINKHAFTVMAGTYK